MLHTVLALLISSKTTVACRLNVNILINILSTHKPEVATVPEPSFCEFGCHGIQCLLNETQLVTRMVGRRGALASGLNNPQNRFKSFPLDLVQNVATHSITEPGYTTRPVLMENDHSNIAGLLLAAWCLLQITTDPPRALSTAITPLPVDTTRSSTRLLEMLSGR